MAFISVTRLRLRSWRFYPSFVWHIVLTVRQVRRAAGFEGGWLGGDTERGAWTVTAWSDEAAMRAYRNGGSHLRAMPRLLEWCDEASYAHWPDPATAPPSGASAYERMLASGKTSKVRWPTARHTAGQTVGSGRPVSGQRLTPKISSRATSPRT